MIIWFASGNLHKKKELSQILANNSLTVKIPSEAGLEFAPEETGGSFVENALIKAAALYNLLEERHPEGYNPGSPLIADDSGLCVDALD